jgi:predicted transcriptional regulator of viral defense system
MNKTEQVYKEILKRAVVNSKDLKDISKQVIGRGDIKYLYWKYIYRLIKDGKVGKIKRGLYFGTPFDQLDEKFEVDRYILANKIENGYALGYHSALELHGAAYSAFNNIFILIKKQHRFRPFRFQNVTYVPVINKHHGRHQITINYKNKEVIVTDPPRTFVECLSRVDLCGGWEECLKSLANLKGVEVSDVKEVLKIYQNKTLELKTGYVLELLSKRSPYYSHIRYDDLKPIKPQKNWVPVYIDRNVPSKLIKKWGLYIPEGFAEYLRGI